MSHEETTSLGPEGIYPKIIMSSLQQLKEERFPWQYCIGLKTTHDVDAQRKLDNILKCLEENPKLIAENKAFESAIIEQTKLGNDWATEWYKANQKIGRIKEIMKPYPERDLDIDAPEDCIKACRLVQQILMEDEK